MMFGAQNESRNWVEARGGNGGKGKKTRRCGKGESRADSTRRNAKGRGEI